MEVFALQINGVNEELTDSLILALLIYENEREVIENVQTISNQKLESLNEFLILITATIICDEIENDAVKKPISWMK